MGKQKIQWKSMCLYAAVALTLASTAYWGLFALNAYNTFHEYEDLGYNAYNIYYNINYLHSGSPLQVLVVGNHIAPDQFFAMAMYYFFPTPLALLILQDIVLSFTGLFVFFLARDLLKSDWLGLLFCFLYLINPGMHGLLVYDYHAEVFLIPFYIMAFYYYMKLNKKMFYVSSILLLGVMDVAPILAGTLAVGLAAYEYLYDKDIARRGARLKLSATLVGMAIAALVLYNLVYFQVAGSYAGNVGVPASLMIKTYPLVPFYSLNTGTQCTDCAELFALASGGEIWGYATLGYGLLVGILGFGPAVLLVALPALIFLAPWLFIAMVIGYSSFLTIYSQYMSYAVGGALAASVLGFMTLQPTRSGKTRSRAMPALISFTVAFAVVLAVVVPYFSYSDGLTSLTQSYLFVVSPANHTAYAQLNSVIAEIPQNGSVMTQIALMSHVTNRRYVELIDNQSFAPEYVLEDLDYNVTRNGPDSETANYLSNYTASNLYELYAQNGSAMLYKKTGT